MKTPTRWRIRVLAGLAFAQTMAYYTYLLGDPGNYNGAGQQGDQVAYVDLAQQVLHGTWQGAVHYMPGLPAAIALAQVVLGDPRFGIAVLHGLVYAGLVVAAAWLARAAFGEPSAPWAAALVALNPAIGYYAAQALTEFLTGAVLFGLVVVVWHSSVATQGIPGDAVSEKRAASRAMRRAAGAGLLIGLAGYLRAEYLALAPLFALVVLWLGRRHLGQALLRGMLVLAVAGLAMAPWVLRYTLATGRPALYNESPFSNLVLMGTWFRVFDEQTFTELQRIENIPEPREEAIAQAGRVGPRPDLSARYMQQVRGPYDLPLDQTLALAAENVRLNPRQFLVNHFVLAPVLIWAGHTPVRQADAPALPVSVRYTIWAAELGLLLLALWQAALALRDPRTAALGLACLAIVVFLTLVHVLIGVDERFTTPALPLVGVFGGARLGQLLAARQRLSPDVPALAVGPRWPR